jgi:trehalose 6-phosphate synthase
VAAQDADNPGVLVLSQFAGAAYELAEGALLVNPHEAEAVAAALKRALEMPLAERRYRHARMMSVITANDIHQWASRFLAALSADKGRAAGAGISILGGNGPTEAARPGSDHLFAPASISA